MQPDSTIEFLAQTERRHGFGDVTDRQGFGDVTERALDAILTEK